VNEEEAEIELVPCLTAPLPEAKELLAACEAAEIEAHLERGVCCGKGGCACPPKMQLMVARADIPEVARLVHTRWAGLLEREGIEIEALAPGAAAPEGEGEDPPCPACGTAAPLVEGACSDCGLQLE